MNEASVTLGMQDIPQCIGIIMDGNRRWAKAKGLPTVEGHRAGFDKAKEIIRHAFDQGVGTAIIYAFSTENWNRTAEEVGYLMALFEKALVAELSDLVREGYVIRFVGDLSRLPEKLRIAAENLEAESAAGTSGKTIGIALSYGGRAELVAAANKLIDEGRKSVSEAEIEGALWTAGMPAPNLIIRTGGEKRLSNFLLWQSAYSELFFVDTFWPDFSTSELDGILAEFAERERRHGK